jgi:HEAT repeat protein
MLWLNIRRLKSSDVHTRRQAIKGLSRSRNPRALAALMAALVDESHLARKEAAQALGEIGDAQAVKPLINLIEDSSHHAIVKADKSRYFLLTITSPLISSVQNRCCATSSPQTRRSIGRRRSALICCVTKSYST